MINQELKFEWDLEKAILNINKHGVSFEEATTVFNDEYAILLDDPDHSIQEERFLLLGTSANAQIMIVCHCIRYDSVIRIISARKATKKEREQYDEIRRGW